jgi:hypothetical protein
MTYMYSISCLASLVAVLVAIVFQIDIHSLLRRSKVTLINCIIALEHRHGFMPGDLHGRERIHTSPPQIRGSYMPQVMKHEISEPYIPTHLGQAHIPHP